MSIGSSEEHSKLVREALLFFSSKQFLVWVQNNGVARTLHTGQVIRYGLNGLPDIIGVAPNGKAFFCEVKSGAAVLSKEQKLFKVQADKRGAYFLTYRNRTDSTQFLVKYFPEIG